MKPTIAPERKARIIQNATYIGWIAGVSLLIAGAACLGDRATIRAAHTVRGALMSDIHFDPLADKSLLPQLIKSPISQWDAIFKSSKQHAFATYGSDSNYPLMMSALAQTAKQEPNGYVVYTGDSLRHDFESAFEADGGTASEYPAFATKTMLFVVDKIQAAFHVPVVIALGNNDTTEGDYVMSPSSPFLATLATTIKVVRNAADSDSRTTFRYGGYYAMRNPTTPAHRIVVLNTVLWSTKYSAGSPTPPVPPGDEEMAWLSKELNDAKTHRQKVSLVMHIPPGMDAYSSSKGTPTLMWTAAYTTQFDTLVNKYQGIFATSFAGHIHMDDFRVYANSKPFLAIRTTPAVSPDFGNNPCYSTFTYNGRSGEVHDIDTFYTSVASKFPNWKLEYKFSSTYGLREYDASLLEQLAVRIRRMGSAFKSYQKYYAVNAQPFQITSSNARDFSCSETSFSVDAFQTCMSSTH